MENLQPGLDKAFNNYLVMISSFDESQINIVPYEGSWTAGELCQHIILSASGFVNFLNADLKNSSRPADEKIIQIKHDLLDFTTKLKSPDFIVPEKKDYEKKVLLDSLEKIKSGLDDFYQGADLSKLCMSFELPVYGYLTRYEALGFLLYHSERHLRQLTQIRDTIILF